MAPVHVPFPSPPSFHFNHLPSRSLSFLSSSHFLFHSTTFHPPDSFFYSPIRSRPFTPVIFLSHAFSHFAPFCNSSSETRQPMRTKSVLSKPGPPTDWTNRPENSPLNPPQQKKSCLRHSCIIACSQSETCGAVCLITVLMWHHCDHYLLLFCPLYFACFCEYRIFSVLFSLAFLVTGKNRNKHILRKIWPGLCGGCQSHLWVCQSWLSEARESQL